MGVNVSLLSVDSLPSQLDSDAASSGHRRPAPALTPPQPASSPLAAPNPSGLSALSIGEHHHRRSGARDPPLTPDVAPPTPLARPTTSIPSTTSNITTALDENPVSPSYEHLRGSHRWSPSSTAPESIALAVLVAHQGQHHQHRPSSVSSSDEDEIEISDPSLHPSSYSSWRQEEIDRFGSLQVPSLCVSSHPKHDGGGSTVVLELPPPSENLFHQHRRLTSNCDDEMLSVSFRESSPM